MHIRTVTTAEPIWILDIDNNIVFTSGYEIEDGEIVPVEIFDKDEYSLIGEAV